MESHFKLERPETPRAQSYSKKDILHQNLETEETKTKGRPRLESDTTLPESLHEYEHGYPHVFNTIKKILEKEPDNKCNSVPSKILEDPEIEDSVSEDSVSEDEVQLDDEFSDK